jgi:hypothetical protein
MNPLFASITLNPLLTITVVTILRVMVNLKAIVAKLILLKRTGTFGAEIKTLVPVRMFNSDEFMVLH